MEFAGLAYSLLAADAVRLASFRGRQDRGQEGYEWSNDQDAAKRDGSMRSAIGHGLRSSAALPGQRWAEMRGCCPATPWRQRRRLVMAERSERSARLLVRALYHATDGEQRWWVLPAK